MPRKPFFRDFDGWWYAQVRVGNKRKQVKLVKGRKNEQEAYRAFCRLMADENPVAALVQPTSSVAVLCDLFLEFSSKHHQPSTYELHRHFLQNFCGSYGRVMPTDLKPFHIHKWLDAHPSWKGARFHAIASIKRVFSWAISEGILDRNPIQSVKKPAVGRRKRIITPEERQQIFDAIRDPHFREFVFAMLETGCRPGEVAKVTAENVDLKLGIWTFTKHKTEHQTHKDRIVYLSPAMVELTTRLVQKYPEGPLFRSKKTGTAFTKNGIRCRFRRLREKFPNLKDVVAYSYRHTFATKALVNGVGIAQVAELLGHTTTDMVMKHYGHLAAQVEHMRQAANHAVKPESVSSTSDA